MLDIFMNEEPGSGLRELHAMLNISQLIFHFDTSGRRITIGTEFDRHPIWTNLEVWKQVLQRLVNAKFVEACEKIEKDKQEMIRQEKESGILGGILKIFGDDKPVEIKLSGTLKINKVLAQSIVFNCQSSFVHYFLGMRLQFDTARELLLHFCKKYELD
jgi:hypothetical protein